MTDRRLLALVRRHLAAWILSDPPPTAHGARRRWHATGEALWRAHRAGRRLGR